MASIVIRHRQLSPFLRYSDFKIRDLENEGQGQGVENRTYAIELIMFQCKIRDFLRILATWEHTFMQKGTHTYTHIHTRAHTRRETGMMTIGKIC